MRERAVMGEPQIFIFSGDAWLHQENKGGAADFVASIVSTIWLDQMCL